MEPYNSDVGRLRIKKKETVLPFRETLAYRMILLAGSVVVFLIALYIMIGTFQGGITASLVSSGVIAAAAAFGIFYNADHLRTAKIPKQTLNRMKRR
jgi:O-antigen/teichoic acid export membrane protein